MTAASREAKVTAKLLKTARMQADETSRRLAALKVASAEIDAAIRLLVDSVYEEEAAARAAEIVGFNMLAGYLRGAGQKRAALEATKTQIASEIVAAERDLAAAFAETMRFEHLANKLRASIEARRRRRDHSEADAVALIRFARPSGR